MGVKEYNIHSSCKYVFETRYLHHYFHLAQLKVHNSSIKSELLVRLSVFKMCLSRICSQNLGRMYPHLNFHSDGKMRLGKVY